MQINRLISINFWSQSEEHKNCRIQLLDYWLLLSFAWTKAKWWWCSTQTV